MASIQQSIELNDDFTSVIYGIISAVNLAVSSMEDMQQAMNADIDTSGLDGVRNEINQATMAMDELNAAMQDGQIINPTVEPVLPEPLVENPEPIRPEILPNAPPEPVEIPVTWQTDGLEVFTGTGIDRFQQEVQSANDMLNTLNTTQAQIEQTASTMDILPDAAVADINSMGQRLQAIQQRIQTIENNPVNMGTDQANRELEMLRSQLNTTIQQQNSLNTAMQNMDVGGANEAYLQLSQTVGNTERYIRDNTDEQGQFNQAIQSGTNQANDLMSTIKGAVAAYLSIQTIGKALDISDELTQTNARLNMMNQAFNEINGTAAQTDDLVELVYGAAQDARGSFADMASVVARFGNNARDAFSSQNEVVAFASLVQKQMTIAGASTSEAANAMLQMSQGLGSGVLRGDELNSIFEQAPNLIMNIADYLGVPIGAIKEMASEGELTADIVKNAIFAASDEINSNFESMPITWSQVWAGFRNFALRAFEPVLERINEIANSAGFQEFVDNACSAMAVLSDAVMTVFDVVGQVGSFISDNWSTLEPIILGVAAAFGLYTGYMIAYNTVQTISNGLAVISAARSAIKAGARIITDTPVCD